MGVGVVVEEEEAAAVAAEEAVGAASMSHRQIRLSSEPLTTYPARCGFHARPQPYVLCPASEVTMPFVAVHRQWNGWGQLGWWDGGLACLWVGLS